MDIARKIGHKRVDSYQILIKNDYFETPFSGRPKKTMKQNAIQRNYEVSFNPEPSLLSVSKEVSVPVTECTLL